MSNPLTQDIGKPLFITVTLMLWTAFVYLIGWFEGEANAVLTLICTGGQ